MLIPYRGEFELLRSCLEALDKQTYRRLELIIVDNGSGEQRLEEVSNAPEGTQVLRNAWNEGFAKALNQGCGVAKGEFALALNSDAFLSPSYIERCLQVLHQHPDAAGVHGKLLKVGNGVIDTTGHILFGDRRVKDRGEFEKDVGQYDREQEVFSFPATAALYRRSALRMVEGICGEIFDEDFFAYGEDVDLAWRLRLAGWKMWYTPEATGAHHRAVSGSRVPTDLLVWDFRNRHLYMAKNDAARSMLRHWWELIFTELRLFVHFLLRRPAVPFRAWTGFFRRLPRAMRKRRRIQSARRISWEELEPWFQHYDYWAFLRRRLP